MIVNVPSKLIVPNVPTYHIIIIIIIVIIIIIIVIITTSNHDEVFVLDVNQREGTLNLEEQIQA